MFTRQTQIGEVTVATVHRGDHWQTLVYRSQEDGVALGRSYSAEEASRNHQKAVDFINESD